MPGGFGHLSYHGEDRFNDAFSSVADLVDPGIKHVAGGGDDFVFVVDDDFAVIGLGVGSAHFGEVVDSRGIVADGDFDIP